MQFAGQRTDENLNPVGDPDNILIKLTDDILPEPDAILVTSITPQKTIADGITEAEFARYFTDHVAVPETIMVGFNNVRFDDEFVRYLLWRNFYDSYEWSWQDGRSRWDLLDVTRMMRALRPAGITWPYGPNGEPSNRLELLSAVNELDHVTAHDALSDVQACILLARMIRDKQPKLFNYLLTMRDKNVVARLVEAGRPFVYTSGRYPGQYEKTTIVAALTKHPTKKGMLVYDLRYDPADFISKSPAQLVEHWKARHDDEMVKLPVKLLQYNRCPAVAPLTVLDDASRSTLQIKLEDINANHAALQKAHGFDKKILAALKLLDTENQARYATEKTTPDGQLYEGFVGDGDRTISRMITAARPEEVNQLNVEFEDQRLRQLWPLYKARNFPGALTDEDRKAWEKYRVGYLMDGGDQSRAALFFKRLGELANQTDLNDQQRYLLEEMQLWGQSILPTGDEV